MWIFQFYQTVKSSITLNLWPINESFYLFANILYDKPDKVCHLLSNLFVTFGGVLISATSLFSCLSVLLRRSRGSSCCPVETE